MQALIKLLIITLVYTYAGAPHTNKAYAGNLGLDFDLDICAELDIDIDASKQKAEIRRRCQYSVHSYRNLRFGSVIPSKHATGYVLIDPRSEHRIVSGGITDIGGNYGAAKFRINAAPGMKFRVTVPSEAEVFPKEGRTVIKELTVYPEGILTVDNTGHADFAIGGKLYIPPVASSGNYHARFSVYINVTNE